MRIVAGRHRGRVLAAPTDRAVRPSSDRLREAVFNILAHGEPSLPADARVLDVFAGTGALGLEALSRGAAHATFVEADRAAAALIRRNVEALREDANASIVTRDARRIGHAPTPVALAFLDPPYGQGLAAPALDALAAGGWLAPGAVIVVETGADEAVDWPPGFIETDVRHYGKARVTFLAWAAPQTSAV